jgi:thiamine biosynthesis lipoprotein
MREPDSWATSYSFDAIGTAWRIDSTREITPQTRALVEDLIDTFDRFWSRFREDSVISKIASTPGNYPLPLEAGPLFDFYAELYTVSRGRVTPLVGAALEHWGYDREYSLAARPGAPLPIPAWEDALSISAGVLSVPKPVLLDIGAAGKGLLVDLVSDLLVLHDHDECVVDASGDLRRRSTGGTTERVGLENPRNPALAIGVAEIGNEALAGSATNRRQWTPGVHHVLDGLTGMPSTGVSASWVIAPDAMTADGLATALLLVEPDTVEAHWNLPWVVMFDNGQVRHSKNFPGEVFS